MPDETTRAIDRFFDVVDNGVEAADRILNRTQLVEEKIQGAKRRRRRAVIDADPSEKPKAKEAAPTAVAKRPHFYVMESVDPKSGHTLFVVTDGSSSRAECTTRALADQLLQALEKAP